MRDDGGGLLEEGRLWSDMKDAGGAFTVTSVFGSSLVCKPVLKLTASKATWLQCSWALPHVNIGVCVSFPRLKTLLEHGWVGSNSLVEMDSH